MLEDMHNIYNREARQAAAEQYGVSELEVTEIMEQERYCYGAKNEVPTSYLLRRQAF